MKESLPEFFDGESHPTTLAGESLPEFFDGEPSEGERELHQIMTESFTKSGFSGGESVSNTLAGSPWTYDCDDLASASSSCSRRLLKEGEAAVSFNFCKLTCGQYGSLWPRPSGEVSISKTVSRFEEN